MSNRTLIEINHDRWHTITQSNDFVRDMLAYLHSGSPQTAAVLGQYGIRVFGMRHHSEGFEVRWGTHAKPISEEDSNR